MIFCAPRSEISTAGIDEILHREGRWDGELNHLAKDGRHLVVESRQVLVRDDRNVPVGILEINRDLTERKQTEAGSRPERSAVSNPGQRDPAVVLDGER